jgi:hypothetical protein
MNDCSNAEIRDKLPDLLHDQLDMSARAVVVAHVATCVDCRDELQLLRDLLGMIEMGTPSVDLGRIVSALPKPPVQVRAVDRTPAVARPAAGITAITPLASRRRVWADWRVAAAVTLLVAGGSSAVLLNREAAGVSGTSISTPTVAVSPGVPTSIARSGNAGSASGASSAPDTMVAASSASDVTGQATVATADDHANADLGNDSRLGDLTESQLQKLLTEIDKLPAVPVTDPEPVSLHVSSQVSSSEGI